MEAALAGSLSPSLGAFADTRGRRLRYSAQIRRLQDISRRQVRKARNRVTQAGETRVLQAQPGMQWEFLRRDETEVFYGGEAGGGKSEALLMDALRYVQHKDYSAIIFRREFPDLEDLINRAIEIYTHPSFGAKYNSSKHRFKFPAGARIRFSHLQHLKSIYSHQGQQYDFIGFDELTQFPKPAYLYLFSRLRGKNPNIRRYMRGTGNPDGEGLLWVKARFIDPMPPLATRAFVTRAGQDVIVPYGTPESVTRCFVPCIRAENIALMDNDPDYEARLNLLPEAQKLALKFGIWSTLDRPDQLIQGTWWQKALEGKCPYKAGAFAFGGDFAHFGNDLSVIVSGEGNRPFKIETWPKTRTTLFAQLIAERIAERGYQGWAGVDTVGPGVGVWDQLVENHKDIVDRVDPCNHKDPSFDDKWATVYKFNNLRSQMWWKFRDDMEYGRIDLSLLQAVIIPDPDKPGEMKVVGGTELLGQLQEEIFAHTYRVHNGVIEIISKEDLRDAELLGHSPDLADALVIWNWVRDAHGFGRFVPKEGRRGDYGGVEDEEEDDLGEASNALI